MSQLRLFSPSEQVAEHLRTELGRRRWSGTMPGVPTLAADLGIDRKTVDAALRQIDREGVLEPQGAGRGRRIVWDTDARSTPSLRVALLDYEPLELTEGYTVELQHRLTEAGHTAFFTRKSLAELEMNVKRIARLAKQTEADAWVVAGGSREVLEWFVASAVPAFALFGRRRGLPIAGVGPNKPPAYEKVVRQLVELGHRRLTLLTRSERRIPNPGMTERAFLREPEAHGIAVGPFNLPEWDETIDGFQQILASLFNRTPPTALIIDEAPFFFAAQQFLAQRGLKAPKDVSMICTDPDPGFVWCKPSVAHITWDSHPVVRRIVRWAGNVARGKEDRRQTFTKAEFVDGGTVGLAPK